MVDEFHGVIDRIVAHLAEVLSMTSGQPVRALPAVGQNPIDWQVPVVITGGHDASVVVGLSAPAAQRITAVVLGAEDNYSDADVADTLKEIIAQATSAYVNQASTGLTIAVGLPVQKSLTPPATAWQHDLVMQGDDPPRLAIWVTASTASAMAESAPPRAAAPTPSSAGFASSPAAASHPAAPGNLDVVLDLELPITVRFGETRLTLDALARLGAGSLIDLERAPDDPVDLLVNGRLVARGEVVVIAGCYGVRVREVVSPADRLRSLEG